jgi:hypothetical protein
VARGTDSGNRQNRASTSFPRDPQRPNVEYQSGIFIAVVLAKTSMSAVRGDLVELMHPRRAEQRRQR